MAAKRRGDGWFDAGACPRDGPNGGVQPTDWFVVPEVTLSRRPIPCRQSQRLDAVEADAVLAVFGGGG